MKIFKFAAVAAVVFTVSSARAVTTSTVTFQQGVNGYAGTFDKRISETSVDASGNPVAGQEPLGSAVQQITIDGNGTDSAGAHSPDTPMLIRFDNIINSGTGTIPSNASILDAHLDLTTSSSANAQSGGPFGVSALLNAFDASTSYYSSYSCGSSCTIGSRGPWWQDNSAQRPNGGIGKIDAAVAPATFGTVSAMDVRSMVQQWTNGTLPNFGMTVGAGFTGTTDAWIAYSSGNSNTAFRPKLSVTYTTDPTKVTTIQNGTNTYAGESDILIQSGLDLVSPTDDITTLGSSVNTGQNIDTGETISGASRNRALLKFNDIFGAQPWSAPADKPVAKAWLVMTTGGGTNARAPGVFEVHPMLVPFSTDSVTPSKYGDFGPNPGLQESDGDIGAALSVKSGMINGSEAWFDVTSYLESIRKGTFTDNGLAVMPSGTVSDGWQAFLSGASAATRPRLIIYSDLSTAPVGTPGDFNNDGKVDAADYATWRKNDTANATLANDNGVGTQAARYTLWRSNFGNPPGAGSSLGGSSAVPEPSTCLLLVLGLIFVPNRFRKS
jgi:hypothetical protein